MQPVLVKRGRSGESESTGESVATSDARKPLGVKAKANTSEVESEIPHIPAPVVLNHRLFDINSSTGSWTRASGSELI